MGWSTILEKYGDTWQNRTNEAGELLYSGDGPADRSYTVLSNIDLLIRKLHNRPTQEDEWVHFLRFRSLEDRRTLMLREDPRVLPVWLLVQEAHAYEDGLWWGNFDRGIDPLEWENLYSPPKRPENAWVELIMGIAQKSHKEAMSLPMDILQDIRALNRRRSLSGLNAQFAAGEAVSLPTKEILVEGSDEPEVHVGFPAPTEEAETEFRNLILEIFAP